MIPPTSAFRAILFTGLAFELAGPLVWSVTFSFGSKGQRMWLYHSSDLGHRALLHWVLPIVLAAAYVGLARSATAAWRWAAAGAILGGLPHLLGSLARLALRWGMERRRGRRPDLANLADFVHDQGRAALFVALLGGAVALVAALAAGHRRVATPTWSTARLNRRVNLIAAGHVLLAPLAAACAVALPWSWMVGAALAAAGLQALRPFRVFRTLAFAMLALALWNHGIWIAHARPADLQRLFLGVAPSLYWFPIVAHLALLLGALACLGVACLPTIGLLRHQAWARPLSIAVLSACFAATAVAALYLAADPPPLTYHSARVAPAAAERSLLRAAAYGGVPLLLLGSAWRFLTRDDVRVLFGGD